MRERVASRLAFLLVLVVAGTTFAIGINWGLPSRQANAFLLASEKAAADSVAEYPLSGTGTDRLAGDWPADANLPADAAQHPIVARATLLENVLTTNQIIALGDSKLPAMMEGLRQVMQRVDDLSSNAEGNAKEITKVQKLVSDRQAEIRKYVLEYNKAHVPGLDFNAARDAVNRAVILRRYRLYSAQPDEMLTFRSLARMDPDEMKFDPRMYQYGGLWIYSIGGLIKGAAEIDVVPLVKDRAYYMDKPELMGKFYEIARGYSAAWGVVGALTVLALMRRWTGSIMAGVIAALCFISMPIVVDLAHEGRPHMAAASLLLLAIYAGTRFVESGRSKYLMYCGIAIGLAGGMMPWGLTGLPLIPGAILARGKSRHRLLKTITSGILAIGVFLACNPYLVIHPGANAALKANVRNIWSMYTIGPAWSALSNGVKLIAAGASWPIGAAGLIAAMMIFFKKPKTDMISEGTTQSSSDGTSLEQNGSSLSESVNPESLIHVKCSPRQIIQMLMAAAGILCVTFILFAAGQPADYAGAAVPIDIILILAAILGIHTAFEGGWQKKVAMALLFCSTAIYGQAYIRGFVADAAGRGQRRAATVQLWDYTGALFKARRPVLGVFAEPAPYNLPPIDLYRWRIELLSSRSARADGSATRSETPVDIVIAPSDTVDIWSPMAAPISWADKGFMFPRD